MVLLTVPVTADWVCLLVFTSKKGVDVKKGVPGILMQVCLGQHCPPFFVSDHCRWEGVTPLWMGRGHATVGGKGSRHCGWEGVTPL